MGKGGAGLTRGQFDGLGGSGEQGRKRQTEQQRERVTAFSLMVRFAMLSDELRATSARARKQDL